MERSFFAIFRMGWGQPAGQAWIRRQRILRKSLAPE